MRVLSVGDMHIGASLGGVSRYDEHRCVLEYCAELDNQIDLTVNLGDVFHAEGCRCRAGRPEESGRFPL